MNIPIKINDRYGKLLVLEVDANSKATHKKWVCQCDCGRIISKDLHYIKRWQACEECRHPEEFSITDKVGEVWKDIPGFEGLYQVSNLGRVKSLPRYRNCIHPHTSNVHILRPRICGKGKYAAVRLCNKAAGLNKQIKVHRLVAEAFISNPNGYAEINHKDENKWNNAVENLEYCSRSYNVNYGTANKKRGSHLNKEVAMMDADKNILATFESTRAAARHIGSHPASISHAVKQEITLYGYYWKYLTNE